MILIAFLFVFVIYLVVFYRIARRLNHFCQQKGKNVLGKVLGGLIMFVAVAIIFWDAIPTWHNHDRLCHTEFGLKIYMPPEEWKKKYPERFTNIKPAKTKLKNVETKNKQIEVQLSRLNSEIDFIIKDEYDYEFGVTRVQRQIVDHQTREVLFENTNFYGGVSGGSISIGANSLDDYKFWNTKLGCEFEYSGLREKAESDKKSTEIIYNIINKWGKK